MEVQTDRMVDENELFHGDELIALVLADSHDENAIRAYADMTNERKAAFARFLGLADAPLFVTVLRNFLNPAPDNRTDAEAQTDASAEYASYNPLSRMMYCNMTPGVDLDGNLTWEAFIAAGIAMAAAFNNAAQLVQKVDLTTVRFDLQRLVSAEVNHKLVLDSLLKTKGLSIRYFSAAYFDEFGEIEGFSVNEKSMVTSDGVEHPVVCQPNFKSRMYVEDAAVLQKSLAQALSVEVVVLPCDKVMFYLLGFVMTQFSVSLTDGVVKLVRSGVDYKGPYQGMAIMLINALTSMTHGLPSFSRKFLPEGNMGQKSALRIYLHFLLAKMMEDKDCKLKILCSANSINAFEFKMTQDFARETAPSRQSASISAWIAKIVKKEDVPVSSLPAAVKDNALRRATENKAASPLFTTADAYIVRPVGAFEALNIKMSVLLSLLPDSAASIDLTGADSKALNAILSQVPEAKITSFAATKGKTLVGPYVKWTDTDPYPSLSAYLFDDSGGTDFAKADFYQTKVDRLLQSSYKAAILRFTLTDLSTIQYTSQETKLPFFIEKLLGYYDVEIVSPGKAHSCEFFVVCRPKYEQEMSHQIRKLVHALMGKMILMHAASSYRAFTFQRGAPLRLTETAVATYGLAVVEAVNTLRYPTRDVPCKPKRTIEEFFKVLSGKTVASSMDMTGFADVQDMQTAVFAAHGLESMQFPAVAMEDDGAPTTRVSSTGRIKEIKKRKLGDDSEKEK